MQRYSSACQNIVFYFFMRFYTSDMALIWNGKIEKLPVKISGEVNNLFNQYYDVVLNFPMPGRNYRLSMSINF